MLLWSLHWVCGMKRIKRLVDETIAMNRNLLKCLISNGRKQALEQTFKGFSPLNIRWGIACGVCSTHTGTILILLQFDRNI